MEQAIISFVLLAGVAILVVVQLRRVVKENRERREERAFKERLDNAIQSKNPREMNLCLMGASLWVLIVNDGTGKIMSIEADLPRGIEPPLSDEFIHISPRIFCFVSSTEMNIFRASLLGQLFERFWHFEAITGRVIFEETLKRSIPVVLNFGGDRTRVFEVDEVRAILNAAA